MLLFLALRGIPGACRICIHTRRARQFWSLLSSLPVQERGRTNESYRRSPCALGHTPQASKAVLQRVLDPTRSRSQSRADKVCWLVARKAFHGVARVCEEREKDLLQSLQVPRYSGSPHGGTDPFDSKLQTAPPSLCSAQA